VARSVAMKIVILEDNEERQSAMRDCLSDRFPMYEIAIFDDSRDTIRYLDDHLAETILIALDHDLILKPGLHGRCIDTGTGREVADYLGAKKPLCPVVIHTSNGDAAVGMMMVLKDAGWKTRRVLPSEGTEWIISSWFPAVRRAIVGPIRTKLA
jgi:CheY-like chemotaxis protein